MTLKIFSLFIVTVGLFAVAFLLFFIIAFGFASAATNNENSSAELIIFAVLAIIHISLNVLVISKRSELPLLYTRINTGLVIAVYAVLCILIFNLQKPIV
ncbi:MAG: hypothetical protein ACXVJN_15690 [Mucilaginibacter sp.]